MQQDGPARPNTSNVSPARASAFSQSAPEPRQGQQWEHRHFIAIYPGSFDPAHRGHVDIAKRAARLVDELIIAVYATPSKNLLFSADERVDLWREIIAEEDLTNVRAERFDGLAVHFARSVQAKAIVKGLRAVTDFEAEFQQALMNRNLAPEVETLMIVTELKYLFVSSTLIKEIARLDGDLDGIVTPSVAAALQARVRREKS